MNAKIKYNRHLLILFGDLLIKDFCFIYNFFFYIYQHLFYYFILSHLVIRYRPLLEKIISDTI